MPLLATLQSGNIIHGPITKQFSYITHNYSTASGAPGTGSTSLSQSVSVSNIGPNRTLYVCVISTYSSGFSTSWSATFNGRAMTQLTSTNLIGTYTKPIVWFSVRLLNSETSGTFTFTVPSGGTEIRTMACWYFQGRGLRAASSPYHVSAVAPSGQFSSGFIAQRATLNMNFPGVDRGFLLFAMVKGILDSGDGTTYTGSNLSSIHTNQKYTMTASNSMHVVVGSSTVNNSSTSQLTSPYYIEFNTNSIPVAPTSAIVLY